MKKAIEENTVKAENQLKKSQMVFYVGNPSAKIKIAIVGNSITRHGIKESIGWTKVCGMAASDEEHDYVHILYKLLKDSAYDVCFMVNQLSYWELNYMNDITKQYKDIKDFGADYFIFRLGENITPETVGDLKSFTEELLDFCTNKNTKTIMTSCFWKNDKIDEILREISSERNYPIAELGDLGDMDEMKAVGLYAHSGVAAHPGDKGMEKIAERIYSKIIESEIK